jgi:hypothetical protein
MVNFQSGNASALPLKRGTDPGEEDDEVDGAMPDDAEDAEERSDMMTTVVVGWRANGLISC